jgi:hypothetical protein
LDLDLAEEHAWHAVRCDPSNPKFYNAIKGIQLDRAKRLKTRREVRESMRQRLQEIQRNIDTKTHHIQWPTLGKPLLLR